MDFHAVPHAERFRRLLQTRGVLVADGATGTNLFRAGLESGSSPELLNIDNPEGVMANHEAMIMAGADIILTNSFGGTANRLKLHGAADRVRELNREAARLARAVADRSERSILVAGSMGPTGDIMQPVGDLAHDDAVRAFREQALGLASGGADVIWIETMSSIEETEAAIEGAAPAGLPLVCTMTFDTNGRTMMGVTPEHAADHFATAPLAGFGANCGNGFGELVAAIAAMNTSQTCRHPLVAKANCGIPEYVDGRIRYSGTPEIMGVYARLARDAGASIIGGCCGSAPEHITAIRESLQDYSPGPAPELADIEAILGLSRAAPAHGRKRVRRSRRHR
ncbi:MAG: betaine--homocysteine S-methyltransferase [bacterium]|nr:betaine--homocysteine S-methyltransferase [bacterium]